MDHPRSSRSVGATIIGLALLGAIALAGPAAAQTEPSTTTTTLVGPPEKTVHVLDNVFRPKKVKVAVGTKVTWKWGGVAAHNVVVTKGPQKFKSKTIAEGKFSRTIKKPGKYLIVCTIHPGMKMVLRATNPPPVTTTTVADVPTTATGA